MLWNIWSFWNLINVDLFIVNKNKVRIISISKNWIQYTNETYNEFQHILMLFNIVFKNVMEKWELQWWISISQYHLINNEIINHITTLADLWLMPRALVSIKMAKLKIKMLLEMINHIITESQILTILCNRS